MNKLGRVWSLSSESGFIVGRGLAQPQLRTLTSDSNSTLNLKQIRSERRRPRSFDCEDSQSIQTRPSKPGARPLRLGEFTRLRNKAHALRETQQSDEMRRAEFFSSLSSGQDAEQKHHGSAAAGLVRLALVIVSRRYLPRIPISTSSVPQPSM